MFSNATQTYYLSVCTIAVFSLTVVFTVFRYSSQIFISDIHLALISLSFTPISFTPILIWFVNAEEWVDSNLLISRKYHNSTPDRTSLIFTSSRCHFEFNFYISYISPGTKLNVNITSHVLHLSARYLHGIPTPDYYALNSSPYRNYIFTGKDTTSLGENGLRKHQNRTLC